MNKPLKMLTKERIGYEDMNMCHAYNQACDDWEDWLVEFLPSKKEIFEILMAYSLRINDVSNIAEIISKRIKGENK